MTLPAGKSYSSTEKEELTFSTANRDHHNDRELDEIMHRTMDLSRQADEVHVVFNNMSRDYAPKAAERLRKKLGQQTRPDRSKMPHRPSQGTLF